MANPQERRDKSGKLISYSIRVHRGRGADGRQLKPATMTFKVEPTWTEKSAKKKAEAAASVFEKQIKEGTATDTRLTFREYAEYVISLKERTSAKHKTISSYLKYVLLAVFVVCVPIYYGLAKGVQVPGFCKYICPAGTLEGAMGMLPKNSEWLSMLGPIFTRKFVIMVLIGLACIFCYRAFCRFLCPLGAIYGMFNRLSMLGVKVDTARCNSCGACVRGCKMDVRHVGDRECIHCGVCVEKCHAGALSMKGIGAKIAVRAGMVAVLVLALVWFNFLDPSVRDGAAAAAEATEQPTEQTEQSGQQQPEEPAESWESDAPVGWEPGKQLADFTVECLDGGTFHLADTRGKVTVINLWATYCGPCVGELPHFDALQKEHPDDLAILAVHASLTTEDVKAFVDAGGWDLLFAIDDEQDTVFGVVNGSLALPQTIVLNRKGEVIFNRVGSVTGELLAQLYEQASEG